MKIEVGKYYKSRDGRKCTAHANDSEVYPFYIIGDSVPWHGVTASGASCIGDANSDIIAEWQEGPVRTVTRKEIVPGVYGYVKVHDPGSKFVRIDINDALGIAELRAAAATLIEIADALEDADK